MKTVIKNKSLYILVIFFGIFLDGVHSQTVIDRLKAMNLVLEERPLFSGYGGFGTSLHVDLQASGTNTDNTLIIAMPIEDTYYSEVVYELIMLMEERGNPLPIRLAFLADENPNHRGLEDLLDRYEGYDKLVLLYLDSSYGSGTLRIHHGSKGSVAPLSVLKPLIESMERTGVLLPLAITHNELYHLGLASGPEALALAQGRELPSLFFSGKTLFSEKYEAVLGTRQVSEIIYTYAQGLTQDPGDKDYHYMLFRLGGKQYFLSEYSLILLFIGVFSLILAAVLIYSVTHRRYLLVLWSIFLRYTWIIGFYLIILFLSLLGSGAFYRWLLTILERDFHDSGYGGAALKYLCAIAIYLLFSPIFSMIKLPRRAQFYTQSAVVLLALGTLSSAALDITFLPIFLWAFTFAFIASLTTRPHIALIFALLAPLQILSVLGSAIGSGEQTLAHLLLQASPLLHLFITLLTLPFLLLFKRIGYVGGKKKVTERPILIWLPRILFFLGVLTALLSYASDLEKIPDSSRGTMPIGDGIERRVELTVSENTFLDRRIVIITLEANYAPYRFELSMESVKDGGDILIYDAPMPYSIEEDGKLAKFMLGEYPDNPLSVELVFPLELKARIIASALWELDGQTVKDTTLADLW